LLIADSREQTKPAHRLRIHLAVFGSKEGYQKEPSSCSVFFGYIFFFLFGLQREKRENKFNLLLYPYKF
jgi:hypothetical protein